MYIYKHVSSRVASCVLLTVMIRKRLKLGDVSKLTIFRQANPAWMSSIYRSSSENTEDDDTNQLLFVQLRNAIISVPKNKFDEILPMAQFED